MAKLWKDKTLRERVEVRLIDLMNVETESNPWGEYFWLTSSTPKVIARALENLKKVPDYKLDNWAYSDARQGFSPFPCGGSELRICNLTSGGKIDALIHSLWRDQQREVTK